MPGPLRDIRPVSFTEPAELVFDAEICTKVHTITPTQGQVAKGGILGHSGSATTFCPFIALLPGISPSPPSRAGLCVGYGIRTQDPSPDQLAG